MSCGLKLGWEGPVGEYIRVLGGTYRLYRTTSAFAGQLFKQGIAVKELHGFSAGLTYTYIYIFVYSYFARGVCSCLPMINESRISILVLLRPCWRLEVWVLV